jgi:hypothetical protein
MLEGLVHAHSGLRWVVLILLLVSIIISLQAPSNSKRKIYLFTLIFTHIQLLIGLVLFFKSSKVVFDSIAMKDAFLRFYLVEHSLMMILSVVLITIGFRKYKKLEGRAADKVISVFYGLALVLILIAIPWPFRQLGGSWF